MAASLIGGSVLSAFLQVLFDRMASREVLDFFKGRKLNDGLLEKLRTTIESVNGVLDDAEEKQISKPAVKEWLDKLKDAVYEADDLLDEISYEALQPKLEPTSPKQKVRNFFSSSNSFKKGMNPKLEEILDRLEYLVKQKDTLNLKEGVQGKPWSLKTATTSLVDESGIYGREDDKEAIMLRVLSDDPNGNDLGVIPIVGMGGMGKTTLAQLVYNDRRVCEWFDLKAWVCVSEEFDVFRVTKDIFEELTWKTCDIMTLNRLQLELKERVMGKKFFLVLDDVWNDKYEDWDILWRPLRYGAKGSKVVITTRNRRVASIMQTVPTHHLKQLTDDDCWCLFAKHAFDDGDSGIHSNLKEIGRGIVGKCKGLPLTAKTLGALLRPKRDVEEWEKVLKSNMWDLPDDSILPALKLSYHYLPSHLKRCFAYCSIFPKAYNFKKQELVLLWMAEGFIVQPQGNKEMEEVGDEYFHDLVSRSFFQRSNVHPSLFIMHDLLSDLAKVVSGEFCFRLEGDDSSKISQRTRHLSYGRTKKFEAVTEAKLLRTFLPVERSRQWKPELIDIEVTHNLLPMLKYLRVLSLSKYQCIAELPNSIGNLKHLRFLNLSKTSITNLPDTVSNLFNLQMLTLSGCNALIMLPDSIGNLKHLRYFNLSGTSIRRLPESTCSLYALQTLILRRCKNLVVLPTNMGRLINLKHFDIRETNLREMPPQMGKLTKLKKLTDFVLGEQGGSRIKELRELQDLRGELCIRNLQNIVDSQEAMEADLKVMKHLKMLKLRWAGETKNSVHETRVLEQLQPHKHLSYLSIVGFGASRFPNWVGDHSFSNLLSLKLSGSKRCSSLPPLGQLVSLQDLSITAFDKVEIVGSEFYGRSRTPKKKPFCSLKILRFEKIPLWQEWISYAGEDEEGGAFPLLQELSVKKCPKLIKALPIQLPSLSALEIEGCHQLVDSFPNAPTILKMKFKDSYRDVQLQKLTSGLYSLRVDRFHSLDSLLERLEQIGCLSTNLEEIVMTNCNSLLCFPIDVFPRLKSLHISRCPNLECVFAAKGILVNFSPLSSLEIGECSKLVHFLEGGLPFPNLTRLRLWGCSNLKSLSECMHTLLPSLMNMEIDNCLELESFPVEGLPFKLRSLHIESCNKLIAACKQRKSQLPHSLQCFSIGRNEDLESFPEDKLLPSTLTSLRLWNLENLKFLDCRGLQRLTSLRELKIWNCPNLESMPEEGLPSTLFTLKIGDLQNLKSLDCKGLEHHTSLRDLDIWNCPKLHSMPKDGLPSSLSSLFIYKCPLLEQSCLPETGEDWSKISHISHIRINNDKIN